MTRPKITPGPWKFKKTHEGALTDRFKGFPFTVNGDGFQPCLIFGDGTENRGVAAANAKFIAAAPSMAEALHSLLAHCGQLWDKGLITDAQWESAKQALREAGYTD